MKVIVLDCFFKDIKKIKHKKLKQSVKNLIIALQSADSFREITNVKKMKGHAFAFRVRIGRYRVGLYFKNGLVELARFLHRNDIYEVFPNNKK